MADKYYVEQVKLKTRLLEGMIQHCRSLMDYIEMKQRIFTVDENVYEEVRKMESEIQELRKGIMIGLKDVADEIVKDEDWRQDRGIPI